MFRILAMLTCALLCASVCFANPLIGTWEVTKIEASDLITQMSIDRYRSLQPKEISFSAKEMGVLPHEGKENRVAVQYKEVGNDTWSFSIDKGTHWEDVRVVDSDTLVKAEKKELDVVITYTLKRKKK
ncbi:MAG: hypothetical protein IJU76_14745 [Desulfovibrionaceae bacterium]|nr:hypothetical protein [Desulfovibrionaceae bacterium]